MFFFPTLYTSVPSSHLQSSLNVPVSFSLIQFYCLLSLIQSWILLLLLFLHNLVFLSLYPTPLHNLLSFLFLLFCSKGWSNFAISKIQFCCLLPPLPHSLFGVIAFFFPFTILLHCPLYYRSPTVASFSFSFTIQSCFFPSLLTLQSNPATCSTPWSTTESLCFYFASIALLLVVLPSILHYAAMLLPVLHHLTLLDCYLLYYSSPTVPFQCFFSHPPFTIWLHCLLFLSSPLSSLSVSCLLMRKWESKLV